MFVDELVCSLNYFLSGGYVYVTHIPDYLQLNLEFIRYFIYQLRYTLVEELKIIQFAKMKILSN